MSDNELSITVAGRGENVDARALIEILGETIGLLQDIEAKHIDGRANLKWSVTHATKNSPLRITVEGETRHNRGSAVAVVPMFLGALGALEAGNSIPDWLDRKMMLRAKRLVKRVGTELSILSFSSRTENVRVSQRIAANAEVYKLPDKYREYGELEGRLGQITAHDDDHEFCIFDLLTNRKIHCYFPVEDLGKVRDALTRRVRVDGVVTYKRDDDSPIEVEVESWQVLKEDSDLPSLDEVHALRVDLTSGRPSEEVIADIRRMNA